MTSRQLEHTRVTCINQLIIVACILVCASDNLLLVTDIAFRDAVTVKIAHCPGVPLRTYATIMWFSLVARRTDAIMRTDSLKMSMFSAERTVASIMRLARASHATFGTIRKYMPDLVTPHTILGKHFQVLLAIPTNCDGVPSFATVIANDLLAVIRITVHLLTMRTTIDMSFLSARHTHCIPTAIRACPVALVTMRTRRRTRFNVISLKKPGRHRRRNQ
jgi:hypothetical protein